MRRRRVLAMLLIAAVVLAGAAAPALAQHGAARSTAQAAPPAAGGTPKLSGKSPAAEYTPTVRFRLRTELADGKLAFVGIGGDIEGVVNPTLRVVEGVVVQVGLVNDGPATFILERSPAR